MGKSRKLKGDAGTEFTVFTPFSKEVPARCDFVLLADSLAYTKGNKTRYYMQELLEHMLNIHGWFGVCLMSHGAAFRWGRERGSTYLHMMEDVPKAKLMLLETAGNDFTEEKDDEYFDEVDEAVKQWTNMARQISEVQMAVCGASGAVWGFSTLQGKSFDAKVERLRKVFQVEGVHTTSGIEELSGVQIADGAGHVAPASRGQVFEAWEKWICSGMGLNAGDDLVTLQRQRMPTLTCRGSVGHAIAKVTRTYSSASPDPSDKRIHPKHPGEAYSWKEFREFFEEQGREYALERWKEASPAKGLPAKGESSGRGKEPEPDVTMDSPYTPGSEEEAEELIQSREGRQVASSSASSTVGVKRKLESYHHEEGTKPGIWGLLGLSEREAVECDASDDALDASERGAPKDRMDLGTEQKPRVPKLRGSVMKAKTLGRPPWTQQAKRSPDVSQLQPSPKDMEPQTPPEVLQTPPEVLRQPRTPPELLQALSPSKSAQLKTPPHKWPQTPSDESNPRSEAKTKPQRDPCTSQTKEQQRSRAAEQAKAAAEAVTKRALAASKLKAEEAAAKAEEAKRAEARAKAEADLLAKRTEAKAKALRRLEEHQLKIEEASKSKSQEVQTTQANAETDRSQKRSWNEMSGSQDGGGSAAPVKLELKLRPKRPPPPPPPPPPPAHHHRHSKHKNEWSEGRNDCNSDVEDWMWTFAADVRNFIEDRGTDVCRMSTFCHEFEKERPKKIAQVIRALSLVGHEEGLTVTGEADEAVIKLTHRRESAAEVEEWMPTFAADVRDFLQNRGVDACSMSTFCNGFKKERPRKIAMIIRALNLAGYEESLTVTGEADDAVINLTCRHDSAAEVEAWMLTFAADVRDFLELREGAPCDMSTFRHEFRKERPKKTAQIIRALKLAGPQEGLTVTGEADDAVIKLTRTHDSAAEIEDWMLTFAAEVRVFLELRGGAPCPLWEFCLNFKGNRPKKIARIIRALKLVGRDEFLSIKGTDDDAMITLTLTP